MRTIALALALLCCARLSTACDDPPLEDKPYSIDGLTGLGDGGDVAAQDAGAADLGSPADTATGGPDDSAPAPDDAIVDAAPIDASAAADVDAGWQMIDVPKPDVPDLPLQVVSTSPIDGATGVDPHVAFEITFSANLLDASVAEYTVFVKGPGGETVVGDLAVAGNKLSFKAAGLVAPASRVTVELSTLVQSDKGDPLAQPFKMQFYTAGYPDTAGMAALAARYAPVLRQAVGKDSKGLDYLRSPDFDMDWDGGNNLANLSKFDPLARVGWTVVQSQSHFFIHYAFYWPRRLATTPDLSFDNDMSGATVVVARYPAETPVALLTWFKNQYDEQMWAWATTEGALLPAGKSAKSANLRSVLSLSKLFPETSLPGDGFGCKGITGCVPRRYRGLLTAGSHQSCLWSDPGDKTYNQCRTDSQATAEMKVIRYRPGAVATKASGEGAAVGDQPPTFVYELVPIFESWFSHREEIGPGHMFAGPLSWVYKPPAGRPAGPKTAIASRFISVGQADFGRPPWAWQWKPGTFVSYYDMPLGTPFLDPAWALFQRLGGEAGGVAAWNASTKKGLSVTYCFDAFLGIDARDTAPCKDALPAP